MMEAGSISEMSKILLQCYSQEDGRLHNRCHENLKSSLGSISFIDDYHGYRLEIFSWFTGTVQVRSQLLALI